MIQPFLDCDNCISDKSMHYRMVAEVAQQHHTNTRRLLCLYYRYLATGRVTAKKQTKSATKSNQMIDQAIRRHYFRAKRLSLRADSEMMLLEDYVGHDREIDRDAPKWSQFRHHYYGNGFHYGRVQTERKTSYIKTTSRNGGAVLARCQFLRSLF